MTLGSSCLGSLDALLGPSASQLSHANAAKATCTATHVTQQLPELYHHPAQTRPGDLQVEREEAELAALNAKEAAELAAATPAADPAAGEEAAEEEEAAQRTAISMLHCCRSVDEYQRVNRISEGTYGIVFKCAAEHAVTCGRRLFVSRPPLQPAR